MVFNIIFPFIDKKWDFRFEDQAVGYWWTNPDLKKDAIKAGPQQPRDYILNRFYKTKDAEDVHKKVYHMMIFGAKAALVTSVLAIGASGTRNPWAAARKVGKYTFFIGGGFVSYGAFVPMVANIRGVEDGMVNHFIAGALCGTIPGYASRKSWVGCVMGAIFGFSAAIVKWHYLQGKTWGYHRQSTSSTLDGKINLSYKVDHVLLNTYAMQPRQRMN